MTTRTWNWKRTGSGIFAGAAAALLIGASVGTALAAAAPTWTVKPGGVAVATSGKTILKDLKTHTVLQCASSSTKETLKKGAHLAGANIGAISTVKFTKCTGPFGLVLGVKPAHLPWHLNAVSYNKKTGTTTGSITGVHATISGSGCTAVVDGTGAAKNNGMVKVTYVNKTHKLTVLPTGGNLHVYNVSAGCLGLVNSKDPSSFTAVYVVKPGQTITSP
jgi:hypothetical protein